MNQDLPARWRRAMHLVRDFHDVLHGRPVDRDAPAWSRVRGWDAFLGALSDEDLQACESRGLSAWLEGGVAAPPSLRELAREVADVVDLPASSSDAPVPAACFPRASDRKRAQLSAFALAARGMSVGATRVVDLGSGHGHLTRHLSLAMGLPAVGIERDAARVEVARTLVDGARVTFETRTAVDGNLGLRGTDLAVGLHACGDLGDNTVKAAAASGASLALVPCCPQKRAGAAITPWHLPAGTRADEVTVAHEVLGLASVSSRGTLVEAPMSDVMESRGKRTLVNLLLGLRGVSVAPGEEMRGVNRRQAMASDEELARQVFAARGLPPPTPGELDGSRDQARVVSAAVRRQSLPRSMLGRLLEVALVLDRAMFLVERGRQARVEQLFPLQVSPRNLVLLSPR